MMTKRMTSPLTMKKARRQSDPGSLSSRIPATKRRMMTTRKRPPRCATLACDISFPVHRQLTINAQVRDGFIVDEDDEEEGDSDEQEKRKKRKRRRVEREEEELLDEEDLDLIGESNPSWGRAPQPQVCGSGWSNGNAC